MDSCEKERRGQRQGLLQPDGSLIEASIIDHSLETPSSWYSLFNTEDK